MFGIFKKNTTYDLSWLGVDMHSHLIPGIDDGCPDPETSMECIAGLQELGLHTFFATPHIYSEVHPNDRSTIELAHQRLQRAMGDVGRFAEVRIQPAAEYMIDDAFAGHYATGSRPLTLPGDHILIEMSYQYERKDFNEHVFQLRLQGFKPILAHPERYNFYHSTPQVFRRIKERGCKLQLNLLSLSGYYGEPVRKMAQNLVREGMIDFIGTDLHHTKHLRAIQQFAQAHDLQKTMKGNVIQNESFNT